MKLLDPIETQRNESIRYIKSATHNKQPSSKANLIQFTATSDITMSTLSSPQPRVLTDEPKWSSASLSITLNHLGRNFRPEYTHQLVADECWRGYRPLESVLREANADYKQNRSGPTLASECNSILHKSHKNHDTAASELEIKVFLSPCCQKCSVDVVRFENTKSRDCSGSSSKGEPDAKRRKTDRGPDSNEKISPSPSGVVSDTKGQNENNVVSSLEPTSLLPMKDSEIMEAMCKALPPTISQGDTTSQIADSFLSDPIGDVLEEYSIPVKGKVVDDKSPPSNNYVLTIADGRSSKVSDYHHSVQKLSLFYIENADTVDVANDADGGYWKIMYIFQKHDGGHDENGQKVLQYSLVGFFTLFHFIALFRKPDPGLILRVCQALILPSFQGQGHGRRLLHNVYKLAHSKNGGNGATSDVDTDFDIVQVNVEDPAPAFVALRNRLDFEFVLEHHTEWNWPENGSIRDPESSNSLASNDNLKLFFTAMTEKEASEVSAKAKVVPKQIHIANELFKLKAIHACIEKQKDNMSGTDKETIERLFRLMVKRRLNKEHRDELLEEPSKDAQKALLAKLFDRELVGYTRILSKMR